VNYGLIKKEATPVRRTGSARRANSQSQCHAEDFAFETLAIADDSSRDYVKMTGVDGKVTWVFDKENFARQRLRIKARKMILARMAPRKYGNP
jgi:hypothetical protein